jgi:hypothetical protein
MGAGPRSGGVRSHRIPGLYWKLLLPSNSTVTSNTQFSLGYSDQRIIVQPRHALAFNSYGQKTFRLSSLHISASVPRLTASTTYISITDIPDFFFSCTSSSGRLTTSKLVRYREVGTQDWITVSVPTTSTSWQTSVTRGRCYEAQTKVDGQYSAGGITERVTTDWRATDPSSICVP